MENEHTVSVIILCHNTKGIEICVRSICGQLGARDELILVDDHSSKMFLSRFPSFLPPWARVISVPDPGKNRACNRNLGAAKAKGDILVFMDGDIAVSSSALEQIRSAYRTNTDVAYVGTEHGMKYDEQQAVLISGREDYMRALASADEREAFFHDPVFADWRGDDLRNPEDRPYFWLRFYTSFCAVRRNIFMKAGGFDESFLAWGAEDVDLGYRIGKLGGIGYLPQVHCIHIPHQRDSFRNELTNRKNTYYMVGKYLNWQIETLAAFGSTPKMQRMIGAILRRISAVKLHPLPMPRGTDTLYIDAPGRVLWFGENAPEEPVPMLGMAIPVKNRAFSKVILSDHIFLYPAIVTARILQEAIRIGKIVLLVRSGDQIRLGWDDGGVISGLPFPRICRYATELLDFDFYPDGTGNWLVRSGTFAFTPDPNSLADIRDADGIVVEGTVLINLSSAPDGEAADAARQQLKADILMTYCFGTDPALRSPCLLCERIPDSFCAMRSRLAYCVDAIENVKDISQWMKRREKAGEERIFDLNGRTALLQDCVTPSED